MTNILTLIIIKITLLDIPQMLFAKLYIEADNVAVYNALRASHLFAFEGSVHRKLTAKASRADLQLERRTDA